MEMGNFFSQLSISKPYNLCDSTVKNNLNQPPGDNPLKDDDVENEVKENDSQNNGNNNIESSDSEDDISLSDYIKMRVAKNSNALSCNNKKETATFTCANDLNKSETANVSQHQTLDVADKTRQTKDVEKEAKENKLQSNCYNNIKANVNKDNISLGNNLEVSLVKNINTQSSIDNKEKVINANINANALCNNPYDWDASMPKYVSMNRPPDATSDNPQCNIDNENKSIEKNIEYINPNKTKVCVTDNNVQLSNDSKDKKEDIEEINTYKYENILCKESETSKGDKDTKHDKEPAVLLEKLFGNKYLTITKVDSKVEPNDSQSSYLNSHKNNTENAPEVIADELDIEMIEAIFPDLEKVLNVTNEILNANTFATNDCNGNNLNDINPNVIENTNETSKCLKEFDEVLAEVKGQIESIDENQESDDNIIDKVILDDNIINIDEFYEDINMDLDSIYNFQEIIHETDGKKDLVDETHTSMTGICNEEANIIHEDNGNELHPVTAGKCNKKTKSVSEDELLKIKTEICREAYNLQSISLEELNPNQVSLTLPDENIETISIKSSEPESDCGYHSSDFEFITEEEAQRGGLINHFNFERLDWTKHRAKIAPDATSPAIQYDPYESDPLRFNYSRDPYRPGPSRSNYSLDPYRPGPSRSNYSLDPYRPGPSRSNFSLDPYRPGPSRSNFSLDPYRPGPSRSNYSLDPYRPGPSRSNYSLDPHGPGPSRSNCSLDPHGPGPSRSNYSLDPHGPGPSRSNCSLDPHGPGPSRSYYYLDPHGPGPSRSYYSLDPHGPGPSRSNYSLFTGEREVIIDESYRENYVMPDEDQVVNMFHDLPPAMPSSEIHFLENKSLHTRVPKLVQYEGVGFDLTLPLFQDIDDEEYRDEAEETMNKIFEMYPDENDNVRNGKRRRKG